MQDHWLTRLWNDAAFPLLALAVAVSQVKLGPHKRSDLLDRERPSAELQLDGRTQEKIGSYGSNMPSGNAPVAKGTALKKELNQHE